MDSTLLYSVFHLNLAFSSIAREDYALVIERCYYPILDLIEDGLPVAIEATAQTLIEIERIDKSFCVRVRRLIDEGKTEFIGSGFSQLIMPLTPEPVNRWNLALGGQYYGELLGVRPEIALVNEQTFSAGIVDLYKEAGIEAIIMDWSNSYQYNKYPKDYLFYPQSALGLSGDLTVLWSHSISFQKFQRYAHGELTLEEYKEFLLNSVGSTDGAKGEKRSFPLYVNDAEIFAYRPGSATVAINDTSETEWGRISVLLKDLNSSRGFELALPGRVIKEMKGTASKNSYNKIRLTSSETPVPCKKQKKYNPIRWAVTGRDSVHINTECYAALKRVLALEGKLSSEEFLLFKKKLCQLWGSDYRTNTTDEKLEEFRNLMGWVMVETKRHLDDLALPYSPSTEQLPEEVSSDENIQIQESEKLITIRAGETTVELLKDKGLAIKSLVFASISDKAVIGTLSHGFYEDIHYGADFFSGHLINVEKDGNKVCDLLSIEPKVEDLPGRVIVSASLPLKFGELTKSYEIFKGHGRVDLVYKIKARVLEASSLRLGIFTFNPDAFDPASLFFEAVSGGTAPERFYAGVSSFDHGAPVSPTVTATNCLGATTGEITVGDSSKSVSITSDRAELYCVPLVKFAPVDEKYFFRVSHSIGERDETAYWTWRGLNTIRFQIRPVKSN